MGRAVLSAGVLLATCMPLLPGTDVASTDVASTPVAVGLVIDGLRTDVRALRSPRSVAELTARYAAAWCEGQGVRVDRRSTGSWSIVSRQLGARHEIVQLRVASDGGSEGYVSLTDLARARAVAAPPLRLPAGTRVLRTVEAEDAGTTSRDFVVLADAAGVDLRRRLDLAARASGWRADDVPLADPIRQVAAERPDARRYTRDSEELYIVDGSLPGRGGALLHHVVPTRSARP